MATWSSIGPREVKATGLLPTDAEPSAPGDGLEITSLRSFAFTLECDPSQSFSSSAGQLDVYLFDPLIGAWSLVPDAHQQVPPEAAGKRRFTMFIDVTAARGRIAFVPNGLSVTSGTMTAYYLTVGR